MVGETLNQLVAAEGMLLSSLLAVLDDLYGLPLEELTWFADETKRKEEKSGRIAKLNPKGTLLLLPQLLLLLPL